MSRHEIENNCTIAASCFCPDDAVLNPIWECENACIWIQIETFAVRLKNWRKKNISHFIQLCVLYRVLFYKRNFPCWLCCHVFNIFNFSLLPLSHSFRTPKSEHSLKHVLSLRLSRMYRDDFFKKGEIVYFLFFLHCTVLCAESLDRASEKDSNDACFFFLRKRGKVTHSHSAFSSESLKIGKLSAFSLSPKKKVFHRFRAIANHLK